MTEEKPQRHITKSTLAVLACFGGLIYGLAVAALFGRQWRAMLRARSPRGSSP